MWRQAKQSGLPWIGPREVEEVEPVVRRDLLSSLSIPLTFRFVVESHLATQRAAVKMLYDRILVLIQYVTEVIAGTIHIVNLTREVAD